MRNRGMQSLSRGIAHFLGMVLLLSCLPASALVVYVDKDAIGANNGTSWPNAFTTIQPAIDTASAGGGGEVWVAEDIYGETRANPTGSLVMRSGVNLYGGFSGMETNRNERNARTNETTIEGVTSRGGAAALHVILGASSAILDGFVIRGGVANILSGLDGSGGGILCDDTSPEITNCIIRNNSAYDGGGVFLRSSNSRISRCCLIENTAIASIYDGAGGLYAETSTVTVENCLFWKNYGHNSGGGLLSSASSLNIMCSTFFGNTLTAGGLGSSLYLTPNSSATVSNTIAWGGNSTEEVHFGGTGQILNSDIQGGYPGTENINADPKFVSTTTGDFHLAPGSPCIDTATPSGAPSSDIDGNPRPRGGGYDMGAYEGSVRFDWVQVPTTAPWLPRWQGSSLVFNNEMWVMGGCNASVNYNDVWHSSTGTTWTPTTVTPPMWSVRCLHKSLEFQGKMWVMGGIDGSYQHFNDVWSSPDGSAWTQVTGGAEWAPRWDFGCVAFKDKMWVLGGIYYSAPNFASRSDVYCSSDGQHWTQVGGIPPWVQPSGRNHFGCLVFQDKIWIIGGYNFAGTQPCNDIWRSADGLNWEKVKDNLPWAHYTADDAVVFDGKMWVLGGWSRSASMVEAVYNDVWCSSNGIDWTQVTAANIWTPRNNFQPLVFNGGMWVLGGSYLWPNSPNDIWTSVGTQNNNGQYSYRYDSVQRLTASTPNNGVHIAYDYDPAGNRLQKRVYSDLQVSAGPANPASGGVANNATDRPVLQLSLSCVAGDGATLQSIALDTSGTGNEATALSGAKVWLDANGNGTVDTGDTQLGAIATASKDNGDLTFSGLNRALTVGAPSYLLVTYSFNGTAGQEQTFGLSLTTPSGVKAYFTDTGGSVTPLGDTVTGATLSISTDTIAPTFAGLISATGGSRAATLSWAAAADPNTPITYGVWMSTASFGGTITGEPALQTIATTLDVPNLTNGQEYFFVVRAQDAAGNRELNTVERSTTPVAVLHTLTLTTGPNGSVSGAGDLPYEAGTQVTVSATPDGGYQFAGWTGDVPEGQETVNPLTLTMNADKTVSAAFFRSTGTVVVSVTPTSAPWSFLDGDGVSHSGVGPATVAGIPTGSIVLTWQSLSGYQTAADATAQPLAPGGAVVFSGTYAPVVTFAAPLPGQRLYAGDTLLLRAGATGGLGQLHYRWSTETGKVAQTAVGGDSDTLELANMQPAQTTNYYCTVTDSTLVPYKTNPASVEVRDHLQITKGPEGGSFVAGDSLTLSVETAGGYPALGYQWKKNGNNIDGATGSELTFNKLKGADAGNYSVEVSDTNGDSRESETAVLTVEPGVPAVQLIGVFVLAGLLAVGAALAGRRRSGGTAV